jgi:hypothetical protein
LSSALKTAIVASLTRTTPVERPTLLSSSDRSEGSQRAPCGGESPVVRVDSYRSILNAYDAGREAIWIHLGFFAGDTRASPAT